MQPGPTGSCFHFPAEGLTPVPQVVQIPARVRPETLRVACVGVFNGVSAGKGGQAEERDQGRCQKQNFASTHRQLIKDLSDSTWL